MLNFCYTFAVFPHLHSEFKTRSSSFELQASTRRSRSVGRRGDRSRAFTLIEMLVVMGIIAILMVLLAPAFTSIKSAGDVTGAAYTIKGVLDTARTYAKANNTYTWVGFLEENVSNPLSPNTDTPPVGRLIMSIVASKDGTMLYTGNLTSNVVLDQTTPCPLIQVGKLV